MAIDRTVALRAYLRELLVGYNALDAERKRLQQAAARLPKINAAQADIIADAQAALTKLNDIEGTAFTLADMRTQLGDGIPATVGGS